ncbi:MAG: putative cytosolic protein [Deltaproteobacteria bacterium]|nr:putative cytosolic protein [Deltaproteobacteria bacterium]
MAVCLLLWYAAPACAQKIHSDAPAILSTAESLFQTMKSRDYPSTWRVLTTKSRDRIVSDTDDAIRRTGGPSVSRESIREDFAAGGPISREYWEGFLRRFDPDDALEKSRWEMGASEKDRAEVLITRQGADRPAVLRMFREGDGWKAGLAETFLEH